jgi:hypothetical protein
MCFKALYSTSVDDKEIVGCFLVGEFKLMMVSHDGLVAMQTYKNNNQCGKLNYLFEITTFIHRHCE